MGTMRLKVVSQSVEHGAKLERINGNDFNQSDFEIKKYPEFLAGIEICGGESSDLIGWSKNAQFSILETVSIATCTLKHIVSSASTAPGSSGFHSFHFFHH